MPDDARGTIGAMRRSLTELLRAAGIESPELDARVLLQAALGLDHANVVAAQARPLARHEIERLDAFAVRRLAHEPVARILGEKEFWGLPFRVTPAVLVPRPETETIVAEVLRRVDAASKRSQPLRILDIGTGSGAILLSLLTELPNASGVGTDISTAALYVARANAQPLGLTPRVAFLACDFATGVSGAFDVVVSNPPYIPSGEIAKLMPDVRDFDPRAALDGGNDGLDAYRRIAADIPPLLARNGHIVVEVGAGQAAPVAALLEAAGLVPSQTMDLAGIPRVVAAQRGSSRGIEA